MFLILFFILFYYVFILFLVLYYIVLMLFLVLYYAIFYIILYFMLCFYLCLVFFLFVIFILSYVTFFVISSRPSNSAVTFVGLQFKKGKNTDHWIPWLLLELLRQTLSLILRIWFLMYLSLACLRLQMMSIRMCKYLIFK